MNFINERNTIIKLIDNRTVTQDELVYIEELIMDIEDHVEGYINKKKIEIEEEFEEQLREQRGIIDSKNLSIAVLLDIIAEIRKGNIG